MGTEKKPIEAVVIRIPDEYSVILNKGQIDGVKEGMRFVIFVEGDEIFDPMTSQNLGRLLITKAKITVDNVQEKFSIAKNLQKELMSGATEAIDAMLGSVWVEKRLPVSSNDIQPFIKQSSDLKVRIGDKAVQVIEK